MDRMGAIGENIKEESGPLNVHPVVAVDLIHRLPRASLGREMYDRVDTLERSVPTLSKSDVAADKFDTFRRIEDGVRSVDLRREVIKNPDFVACTEGLLRQMGADESGASTNENLVHASV